MNRTPIEWVKNPDGSQGYTWNPITGCLNHTPEGLCLGGMFPCYAYRLANGRLSKRYKRNTCIPVQNNSLEEAVARIDPFYPRFWPQRLDELRTWTPAYMMPPRGIFVCDMGELFGDWIPSQWQEAIFEAIQTCPQHRFYLLTKQPQNLAKFSPFPENCWVGVTATDYHSYSDAMLSHTEIEATIKYLSIEPLLSWHLPMSLPEGIINWLIIGACTGTLSDLRQLNKRYRELTLIPFGKKWILQPPLGWVWTITEAAIRAGIPVFQKDNLRPLLGDNLRQEMPIIKKEVHS